MLEASGEAGSHTHRMIRKIKPSENGFLQRHLILGATSLMHVVTDGIFVAINPLLPAIAREFHLSLSEVGILKTFFSGSSSLMQLPAAFLSEKVGEMGLLAAGMGWLSGGLLLMALSVSFLQLGGLTLLSGLGGNPQHPLATSLVSRIYERKGRGSAVGFLNFSGDIGKIIAPAVVGIILLSSSWRAAMAVLGASGLILSFCIWILYKRQGAGAPYRRPLQLPARTRGWGISDPKRFSILSLIGVLDGSTRSTLLTFVPLLLTAHKEMSDGTASFMLSIILVGGACGKFGCGLLTDRMGTVRMIMATELLTALFIVLLLPNAPMWLVPLLFGLGFMLNGTSTVLYTTVAELVDPEKRTRGYGLFYTIYLVSSAVAPFGYGLLGNIFGLKAIFIAISAASLLIIPLAAVPFRERTTSM